MNIWYFKHYGGGPGFGRATRAYHLADVWQRLGHRATIFVARFHHVLNEPQPLKPEMTIGGVRYVSLPARLYQGNSVGRLLNMLDFSLAMFRVRPQPGEPKPDAIIVSSPHPFGIFAGAWLARKYKAKLVFEVRDIWPLSITVLTRKSPWHPFLMLAAFTERFAYSNSDLVASLLGSAEPHMREKGLKPGKFVHLPNGYASDGATAPVEPVTEAGKSAARIIQQWHEEKRSVIIHPGAQGTPNALDRLLQAVSLLDEDGKAMRYGVLLLGGGDLTDQLKVLAEQLGLANVAFVPSVPKAEAVWLTNRADIGYAGVRDHRQIYQYGISFNKIIDFMNAGLPIILPIMAKGDPVTASGCGVVTSDDSPTAIASALSRILDMSADERDEMGARGRSFLERELTYEIIASRYVDAIANA